MPKLKAGGKKPAPLLHIQMVPGPLWGRNLRAIMRKSHWTRVRDALLAKQGLTCAICGKTVAERRALHAHEEWLYLERTDPAVAWLWRITLVCWHCHMVGHPGVLNRLILERRLSEQARTDTIDHFRLVNQSTKLQYEAQLREAHRDYDRRSCREWHVDYGPFTAWVISAYDGDPLNDEPWSRYLEQRWGGDCPLPSLEDIVGSFVASPAETSPQSQHGSFAQGLEAVAAGKAAERRRKALKRQREKLREAKQAASRAGSSSEPSTGIRA